MRALPKKDIPETMWSNQKLLIPPTAARLYQEELRRLGLYERAMSNLGHKVYGGQTEEETHDHFAARFANSVGRIAYATLTPCDSFIEASNTLLSITSYGHVTILDVPSGTGAFSIGLVSVLIELRKHKVLPNLPLTLTILGADNATPSRSIFLSLMEHLAHEAEAVGIRCEYSFILYDALDPQSTSLLIDSWFEISKTATDHIVGILNFSGNLSVENNFERWMTNYNQIVSRLYNKKGAVVWLEPISSASTKSQKKMSIWISRFLPFMNKSEKLESDQPAAMYWLVCPLSDKSFETNVMLHQFHAVIPRVF